VCFHLIFLFLDVCIPPFPFVTSYGDYNSFPYIPHGVGCFKAFFWDKDFVHMGVGAPFTFGFLKISDSHISLLLRIMTLNM
jgi:hypothetical protein